MSDNLIIFLVSTIDKLTGEFLSKKCQILESFNIPHNLIRYSNSSYDFFEFDYNK